MAEDAYEIDNGRYADSVRVAREQAEALGVHLDALHTPKPEAQHQPRPALVGDRILCRDGTTHIVTSRTEVRGQAWLFVESGAAWPADTCRLIDTSRVAQICEDARQAAAGILLGPGGTG
ncbi:hypothetical protein [Embleya sp. NPDC059237]|uniref:hypothetical protein n=1 Tax=Embleya sp. NPDC059237 TaxID=3346784 RepID=UPI00367CE7F3